MRITRILAVSVVSLASVIVATAAVIGMAVLSPFRSGSTRNAVPTEGLEAKSTVANLLIFSQQDGGSSFLYRQTRPGGQKVRLTEAQSGIESEPRFSHDGRFVVYSFTESGNSKSAIWLVGADGKGAHAVTSSMEDALHPVFSPDDSTIIYAASSYIGHHSPLVGPARHDWDLFSRPVNRSPAFPGNPERLTNSNFYDLHSIDAVTDQVNPGGVKVLISTTGYPIGALIEELRVGPKESQLLYQPRVPGAPSSGPAYGEAYFASNGSNIVFLAATNVDGGNFDYNVFLMSEVTGGEIRQISQLHGMTEHFVLLQDGSATLVNAGTLYLLDVGKETLKPL